MRKIVGYNKLNQFFKLIRPYLYTVQITDVEDMPERVWETVYIEPTTQQKKALSDLGDPLMMTTQGDLELECETVLERMTRYQQIVGGYFPYDLSDEELIDRPKSKGTHGVVRIDGRNPKMEALYATIDKLGTKRKAVIWCRFKAERRDVVEEMEARFPGQYVEMGSGLTADEKLAIKNHFQRTPECLYLITSQSIAAKAQTFTAATVEIFYSNSFSASQREQAQRRIWRKGQKHSCLYVDIIMNSDIDKAILKALKRKKDIAEYVMEKIS